MATHSLEKQQEFRLSDEETAFTLSAPWAADSSTVCIFVHSNYAGFKYSACRLLQLLRYFYVCHVLLGPLLTLTIKPSVDMLLYLDAMKKAQTEIDSIVGMEWIPGLNSLDYAKSI